MVPVMVAVDCGLCGCCVNQQCSKENSGSYGQKSMQSHFYPPLPLARELKVVREGTHVRAKPD